MWTTDRLDCSARIGFWRAGARPRRQLSSNDPGGLSMSETGAVTETQGTNRVSAMAAGLVGSEILKIAGEIRERIRAGDAVCNLTVGDFSSKQFPIPERLADGVRRALENGETNYPPSDGVLELRQAVRRFYERELGLAYDLDSVLIAGGARPVIYAIYRAVCDPGDVVIYPTPSWNNNHYCHMVNARGVQVATGPELRFMPTREALLADL